MKINQYLGGQLPEGEIYKKVYDVFTRYPGKALSAKVVSQHIEGLSKIVVIDIIARLIHEDVLIIREQGWSETTFMLNYNTQRRKITINFKLNGKDSTDN